MSSVRSREISWKAFRNLKAWGGSRVGGEVGEVEGGGGDCG